jgi:adenosylcobinamide-GDP ribazoletransferase
VSRPVHAFLVAVQFLTRVPVRVRDVSDSDLRTATAFFPAVGAVVAGAGVLVRAALEAGIGRTPATVAAVAAMVAATGAFHEDGLADTADGLWGGWTAEDRIRIMRDSRIGTYGAAALTLALLFQVTLLATLPIGAFGVTVLAGHVLGRGAGVALAAVANPVSDQGLGAKVIGRASPGALTVAAGTAVAAAGVSSGWWLWCPLGVAALVVVGARRVSIARLGGVTGDVLGATTVLANLAVMAMVVALHRQGLGGGY